MTFLPHTPEEREAMLAAIGVHSVDDLFANIPERLRSGPLALPPGMSEMEVQRLMRSLAARNQGVDSRPAFLGAGAYHHFVPAAVGAITGRSEFYTAYTPYQAEVSQGTLQVIYEYQSMVAELLGLDVSNASMYDASTAAAEACTIAINQTRRRRIAVARGVHPEYREVLATYMAGQGFELVEVPEEWVIDPQAARQFLDESIAGLIVQSPNFWGAIEPMSELAEAAHADGALFVAVVNPLSVALLAPPGQYGADIAVGCGQPLGIPLQYGGPYLGLLAARGDLVRRLPGRIAGRTQDEEGRQGYVLTLQAREQHIRREKATSNICTNHALMALAATVYMSLMGKQGLRDLAYLCLQRAHYAAEAVSALPGFSLAYSAPFFHEFTIRTPVPAAEVNRFLLSRDILGGFDLGTVDPALDHYMVLAVTEMVSHSDIDDLVSTLAELLPRDASEPHLEGAGVGGTV